MSEQDNPTGISRRDVLRLLGVASVASAPLIPGMSSRAVASTVGRIASRPLSVGVLLPHAASASPLDGFLAGLRLRFDAVGEEIGVGRVSLRVENIGQGVGRAVSASRKLVEQDRVDLVVGLMNPRAVRLVDDLFASSKRVFVAASAGESMVQPSAASNIFHTSLNGWQSHRAMGEWAGATVGRRAAVVVSFRDSGYDLLPAFRRGFEVGGGEIVSTHIVDAPSGGASIKQALAEAAAARPDVVYALFSGSEAAEFLRQFENSPLAGRVKLLGSARMAEENRAAITSCAPWLAGLRTPENQRFVEACQKSGRSADSYTLLGYDTASFIAEGLAAAGGDPRHARFAEGLRKASFASPRGRLVLDPTTQCLTSPLYLSKSASVLAELPRVSERVATSPSAPVAGTSGWLQSALAI